MSTVDLETAKQVIAGEYKDDGYDHIIAYRNMFDGLSFKLCRGHANYAAITQYFMSNGWPNYLMWAAPIDGYGYWNKMLLAQFKENNNLS